MGEHKQYLIINLYVLGFLHLFFTIFLYYLLIVLSMHFYCFKDTQSY